MPTTQKVAVHEFVKKKKLSIPQAVLAPTSWLHDSNLVILDVKVCQMHIPGNTSSPSLNHTGCVLIKLYFWSVSSLNPTRLFLIFSPTPAFKTNYPEAANRAFFLLSLPLPLTFFFFWGGGRRGGRESWSYVRHFLVLHNLPCQLIISKNIRKTNAYFCHSRLMPTCFFKWLRRRRCHLLPAGKQLCSDLSCPVSRTVTDLP